MNEYHKIQTLFKRDMKNKERRKIIKASTKANKQSHIWAGKIKYIADLL